MAAITELAFRAMEARAVEAESNMFRAAEAGQELVVKLRETEADRDSILQERHELKQSLENKISLTLALEEELESYRDSSERVEKKQEEVVSRLVAEFEAKEKHWKAKEIRLEASIDQLRTELSAMQRKATVLEEAVASLSNGDKRNSSILSDDGTSLMFEELETLKKKFSELKAHSSELNQNNEELKLQVENLRRNNLEMKETIEEKDAEMAEYMATMGQFRNDNQELNLALQDVVDVGEDVGLTKGNSLFSEVDDRRLLVEDQLKKYKTRCEELKAAADIKTRQISKLRAQNVTLHNMVSGGSESASSSHRLEELLNMERNKNQTLLARITELETSGPSQTAAVGAASNRRETVFAPKRRETVFFGDQPTNSGQGQAIGDSDLMTQLKGQMRQNLLCDEKMQALIREMNALEKNQNKLKAENYQLKMKVQRLVEKTSSVSSEMHLQVPKQASKSLKIVENVCFSPEAPKGKKTDEIPKFVFTEVRPNSNSGSTSGNDDVFDEFKIKVKTEVGAGDNTSKDGKVSGPAAARRKGVSFADTIDEADETSTKTEVDAKENVSPSTTSNGSSSKKVKEKKVRESKIVDADEETKKMEAQCAQQ